MASWRKSASAVRVLAFLCLGLLGSSCQKDNPRRACNLLSFEIIASDNRGVKENVIFTVDENDLTAKASLLTWIDRKDPALLTARFTVDGVSAYAQGKAFSDGKCTLDFSEDIPFEVIARNGAVKTYTIVLNCPQINTELPVLRLCPSSPIKSKTEYVSASATLYSPDTDKGWWSPKDGDILVRGRGNSTWLLPKKPYRLKFPEKISPIGLDHASEKSWVILAHDMDKSLIRNHLAFAISRVLFNPAENWHDPSAILFTPCSQYVNVYMDDNYHGVYQMTDQMNKGDGRIDVEKLTAKDGDDPSKITGGHILETDIHASEQPPVSFKTALKNIRFNHKYPDSEDYDPAQYAYIEDFIARAEEVLYSDYFKDPEKGWRRYFDEKTLADYIIVKELAGDMDAYTSTYIYKRRGVDKLFFGPVWDIDKGWDNENRGSEDYITRLMIYSGFHMPVYVSDDWFNRFWLDEPFRKLVKKRWASRRKELLDTIYRELDTMPVKMEKAIEANFAVWPFHYQASTEAKMPAATYQKEIERIRNLTESRAVTLDRLFN